jgi:hypothetical protein
LHLSSPREAVNPAQPEHKHKGEREMAQQHVNGHLKIVVAEGKVTLEDLHKALDVAVKGVVRGGCNCGLTGFDVSFLRGDPEITGLAGLGNVANIQGGILVP